MNKFIKNSMTILCFTITLTIGFNGLKGNKVLASNPPNPTMDWSWGFPKGSSRLLPTKYWQYGSMNWSTSVSYANEQFHKSPASISISVSNDYKFNNCKIRLSSNYWQNVPWAGITNPPSSNGSYGINLNSDKVSNETERQLVVTHEICHAFGLNDCTRTEYLMCEKGCNVSSITNYENNLFVNRYGRY